MKVITTKHGWPDVDQERAILAAADLIDSLAKDGRRFTDAHSASAVCTPSRYALLTGQYPLRAHGGQGVWGPLSPHSGLIIPTDKLTIGKALQNVGYATSAFGKWHLGFNVGKNDWSVPLRPGPRDVGFDYYTHQGRFVLGGDGEGSYADFDGWTATAGLKLDRVRTQAVLQALLALSRAAPGRLHLHPPRAAGGCRHHDPHRQRP